MIAELRSPIQDVPKLGETKVADAMKEATACFLGEFLFLFFYMGYNDARCDITGRTKGKTEEVRR